MKIEQKYKVPEDGGIPQDVKDNLINFHKKAAGRFVNLRLDTNKPKTTPQVRYWFGVVLRLITDYANDMGETTDIKQWYDYYVSKGIFGYKEFNNELVPKSLSEATVIDVMEAKEKIQIEWSKRGLDIPDPNEEDYRRNK